MSQCALDQKNPYRKHCILSDSTIGTHPLLCAVPLAHSVAVVPRLCQLIWHPKQPARAHPLISRPCGNTRARLGAANKAARAPLAFVAGCSSSRACVRGNRPAFLVLFHISMNDFRLVLVRLVRGIRWSLLMRCAHLSGPPCLVSSREHASAWNSVPASACNSDPELEVPSAAQLSTDPSSASCRGLISFGLYYPALRNFARTVPWRTAAFADMGCQEKALPFPTISPTRAFGVEPWACGAGQRHAHMFVVGAHLCVAKEQVWAE